MSFVRTALAGGILFLLPFGLLVFILGEVLDVAMVVARPISRFLPEEDLFGQSAAVVIAWALVFLACYLAGCLARWSTASRVSTKVRTALSRFLPGYRMIEAHAAHILGEGSHDDPQDTAVLVPFGAAKRFGFEVSRDEDTQTSVVFLPGSPDPGKGIVISVESALVEKLPISAGQMMASLQFYGRLPLTPTQ